ncbi:MAG: hypothetical protein JSS02_04240 [Planctomycetes bacterium]|nr:hypothetical protein [Planctomycetota bacterium]
MLSIFKNPKTRRIVWPLSLLVVAIIGGGLVYGAYRHHRIEQLRQLGMSAMDREDYAAGLKLLGECLQKDSDDAEVLFQFATAREHVLAPRQEHLSGAVVAWKSYCELQPKSSEGWKSLARVSALTNDLNQAILAAGKAVMLRPRDLEARQILLAALIAKKDFHRAENEMKVALEVHGPTWQILMLQVGLEGALLDQAGKKGNAELIAKVAATAQEHADDPRYLGVLAATQRLAGDPLIADQLLREAALKAPADRDYLRWLVQTLSDTEHFDVLVDLVMRHPKSLHDRGLAVLFARRCWELGQFEKIADHVEIGGATLSTDPELILLKALACQSLDRPEEAQRLLVSQDLLHPSEAHRRWFRVLSLALVQGERNPREVLDVTRDALEVTARVPLLHVWQAEAWMQMSEFRLASQAARRAARQASHWYVPFTLDAAALLRIGQTAGAYVSAVKALEVAPDRFDSAILLTVTWLNQLDPADLDDCERLRKWLDRIAEVAPNTEQERVAALRKVALDKMGPPASTVAATEAAPADEATETTTAEPAAESPVAPKKPVDAQLVEKMASASPEGATAWRLLKARDQLTRDKSTAGAAAAALLLRPVLDRVSDHPDANLLAAMALARLHNVRTSAEHLNKAVTSAPSRIAEALQLAVTFRVEGYWTDPSTVVDSWVDLTRIEYRINAQQQGKDFRAGSAQSASANLATIIRLVILAELAERSADRPLAIATYRELLKLDSKHHLACNNLASHLSHSRADLPEALTLASRAVELAPENATYAKTLNEVEAALDVVRAEEEAEKDS